MSDSTTNSVSRPIPPNDSRRLPELAAKEYGFSLVSHDIEGKRYYAIQDWISGVAQVDDPRKFWFDVKRRLNKAGTELSSRIRQLPYVATDGKTYKVAFVDDETLYLITQRMDANTGLRNAILQFLAKSGVKLDDFRIDPDQAIDAAIEAYRRMGKSEKWIATRIQSKAMRLRFTAAFRQALRQDPSQMQYAIITDEMRVGLWRRKTAKIKQQMGLKKNDSLRDNMGSLALSYELLAENISAEEFERRADLKFNESKEIVRKHSESLREHAESVGNSLGIDIATDKPLLPDRTKH
jgi:hypothetical protein